MRTRAYHNQATQKGRVGGRVLLLLGALLVALPSLNACSKEKADGAPRTRELRLAHNATTTHPVHKGMADMAERLERISGGAMTLTIYPSEQLGTEREVLELLQLGSLDMGKVSAAKMESFAPSYEVLSLPYVFRDDAHCWAVLKGEVGKEILAAGEANSLRGLCFYDAGKRSFYTIDKPIRTPDDLQGLKIRVQESPTAMALVETLGGAPTPIPWGELYTALQQGVVDGAENNSPSVSDYKHYEVAKFYTLNEHTAVPDVLIISTHTWEKLTEQERAWLQQAADESVDVQRGFWKESSDAALAQIRDAGVEIIEPDRQPFMDKVKPLLERYRSDPKVADLLDRIDAVESSD